MKTPENAGFKMFLEANCGLTNGRDGGDDLAKLELAEDRGLASGVETDLSLREAGGSAEGSPVRVGEN